MMTAEQRGTWRWAGALLWRRAGLLRWRRSCTHAECEPWNVPGVVCRDQPMQSMQQHSRAAPGGGLEPCLGGGQGRFGGGEAVNNFISGMVDV